MGFNGAFAKSLIEAMSTGTYTVVRSESPQNVKGRPVPGKVVETFDIIASIQPLSGRDLLRLPEGRRTTESRTVYTTTRLQTGGQGEKLGADRLKFEGAEWEVQNVEQWPGHFRCVIQLAAPGQAP